MQKLIIEGGRPLRGDVVVHGAKNSALPILAACLTADGVSVIHNCPRLSDVRYSLEILEALGCKTGYESETAVIDASGANGFEISEDLMRKMRSSVVFLGAVLARFGKAKISFPGGCELGPRPIDLHLSALRQMGAEIYEEHGFLHCSAKNGLDGADIALSFPSVGATENIMLAASLARGETQIINAAREPEVIDLADYLNACGAKIFGAGKDVITIFGVKKLHGAQHSVIPDRIAAATYLSAVAAAGGSVCVLDAVPRHLSAVLPLFRHAGCDIEIKKKEIRITSDGAPGSFGTVRTMPYPGFPTDSQALIMAASTLSRGTSIFIETIFQNRYKQVGELLRMGANIKIDGRVAVVEGVERLHGASVVAHDLRCAASLIIAGLAARGETEITGLQYLDRGYESPEERLRGIGARIRRE
ncbi:MAG: UDP-N-acetylglucosamine 1-carboxyvinyltransferase [Clostridia bacterium]|nr:UDP-N-acetylglucosamine 1-carboxyvinyltransferase [Clostridia bacterium]